MSKQVPPVVVSKNSSINPQPLYLKGEKVFYTIKGVSAPCIIQSVVTTGQTTADGANITYVVRGDIEGGLFPSALPSGPFKNVLASQLIDRP